MTKFFDLDSNGNIDKDAERLLNELKYSKIRKKVPASNIIEFVVSINSLTIEHDLRALIVKVDIQHGFSYETHKEYIENFGNSFYQSVKSLIDKNARKKYFTDSFNENEKALISEIIRHAKFSIDCVKKFHGRVNMINKVLNQMLNRLISTN